MTIDSLKRVIWRLLEEKTTDNIYSYKQIRLAIMEEIGVDERTIARAIKRMHEFRMVEKAEFGSLKVIYQG